MSGSDPGERRCADRKGMRVHADLDAFGYRKLFPDGSEQIAQEVRAHHGGAASAQSHGTDLIFIQIFVVGEDLFLQGSKIGVFLFVGSDGKIPVLKTLRFYTLGNMQIQDHRFFRFLDHHVMIPPA